MEAWVTSIRRWAIGETLPTVNTAGVTVETIFFNGQVDVDDVAFFSGLSSGMPWQMTWWTEVQQDFG